MGLFLAQVNVWNSIRPEKHLANRDKNTYVAYGDYYLLNTNRCVDIKDKGAYLQCKYNQAPDDHRCSPDTIEFQISPYGEMRDDTQIDIFIQHGDLESASKFAIFDIYPDMDITQTPVTTEIEWDDIAYIYAMPNEFDDSRCHMVYYDKSWKRVFCIVNRGLLDILVDEYSD
jgi:hypothetical protein